MKYYIIAGEASGDLHGANLMRALREKDPDATFRFWGGDRMAEVGGQPVRHIRDLAYMGFVEVVTHLDTVLGNIRFCKQDVDVFCPDVLITIDYPGFNLKIAKYAHDRGFKTVHYISPQLWAWKKGRIKTMCRDLDRLCYILPFEQEFYKNNHMPGAVYVGHPLLDAVSAFKSECERHTSERPVVALLPGSRRQELKKMYPEMLKLAYRHKEYDFVVAGMTLLGDEFYRAILHRTCREIGVDEQDLGHVKVVYNQTYQLLSEAYAAVVCSGTATLETALFNVPQVVCYKANPISIAIARPLVSGRVKYISLVNLIVDEPVVTELIQEDLNEASLEKEFGLITVNPDARRRMLEGYARLHSLVGNAGASARTAEVIISLIRSVR